jgi:hypothetical protein
VEQWKKEGIETTLLKKQNKQTKKYRIQREMKKMDNQLLTTTKQ